MVKRRWPIVVLVICIAAGIVFSVWALLSNKETDDNSADVTIIPEKPYVVDVYKCVALRKDGYVNSEVISLIDKGTVLHPTGIIRGPMIQVKTESGILGYVNYKYLTREDAPIIRKNIELLDLEDTTVYFIGKASSVTLYNNNQRMEEGTSALYLMKGTPVQIINTWDTNTNAFVVDCESGMLGFLSDYKDQLVKDYDMKSDGKTPNGKLLGDKSKIGSEYEYPVNSLEPICLYKEPSEKSEILDYIRPGTWMSRIDKDTRTGFSYVKNVYSDEKGYIKTKYLYSIE